MPIAKTVEEKAGSFFVKGQLRNVLASAFVTGIKNIPDNENSVGVLFRTYTRSTTSGKPLSLPIIIISNMVYPSNPRTPAQQAWRGVFRDGVAKWHGLTNAEKSVYNEKAKRRKTTKYGFFQPRGIEGFNLFMSDYLKGKIS